MSATPGINEKILGQSFSKFCLDDIEVQLCCLHWRGSRAVRDWSQLICGTDSLEDSISPTEFNIFYRKSSPAGWGRNRFLLVQTFIFCSYLLACCRINYHSSSCRRTLGLFLGFLYCKKLIRIRISLILTRGVCFIS